MDGDGSGDFNAHTNANDFLMVMVHYSWITVLIITLLGICSFMSHRKKQKGYVDKFGTQQKVRYTPGLLAHGGYPFIVRGVLGTTFFMLGVLPLILIICATLLGLILAAVEEWEAGIGVEYLLSNILGMTAPLTNVVPEGSFGVHFAIIMNMYAVVMITTAMGLVANMSLMQAITEKVPQGTCGFVSFLLVVVPLVMLLTTWLIGCTIALVEGWPAMEGYYFMAASMASLANPVTSVEPETAFGAFFECLCLSIELCLGGCVLGLVASHPVTTRLCDWLEGTSRASHTDSQLDLAGYTVLELRAKLEDISEKLGKADDTCLLQKKVAQLMGRLDEGNASEYINQLTGEVFKLEERVQAARSVPKEPHEELRELRARVAELEELVKAPENAIVHEVVQEVLK